MEKEMITQEMLDVIEAMSEEEKDQFFDECFSELSEELFGSKDYKNLLNL